MVRVEQGVLVVMEGKETERDKEREIWIGIGSKKRGKETHEIENTTVSDTKNNTNWSNSLLN